MVCYLITANGKWLEHCKIDEYLIYWFIQGLYPTTIVAIVELRKSMADNVFSSFISKPPSRPQQASISRPISHNIIYVGSNFTESDDPSQLDSFSSDCEFGVSAEFGGWRVHQDPLKSRQEVLVVTSNRTLFCGLLPNSANSVVTRNQDQPPSLWIVVYLRFNFIVP